MERLELKGRRFGRWQVVKFYRIKNGHSYWRCLCECGRIVGVQGTSLIQGRSRFCSTCSRARNGERRVTHGMRRSPEYRTWSSMKNRCSNRKFSDYKYYGGRGIRVCRKWLQSFEAFYSDMGKRPIGRSIDRKNSDGNYTPRNCRWATAVTQSRNRRARCK